MLLRGFPMDLLSQSLGNQITLDLLRIFLRERVPTGGPCEDPVDGCPRLNRHDYRRV